MRKSRNEPIPIPPPQDIMSDATPEVMEALLISESKRTYNEIAKLEASVNVIEHFVALNHTHSLLST